MKDASTLQAIQNTFHEHITSVFQDDLEAIFLYGHQPHSKSDIQFLVIVNDSGMEKLEGVRKYLKKWRKQRIAMPLIVTRHYIESSIDSFPIEFLNIRETAVPVFGSFDFTSLAFNKQDVRLQCERELKGKLLHLREGYLLTDNGAKAMRHLIAQSLPAFTALFNGLLFLKDQSIPKTVQETVLQTCREFSEIDEGFFSELIQIAEGRLAPDKDELNRLFKIYISQIESLSHTVDQNKL